MFMVTKVLESATVIENAMIANENRANACVVKWILRLGLLMWKFLEI